MQKLKLLPSLKEKKRYLVYEGSTKLNHQQILDYCNQTLGIFDGAAAGLRLMVHTPRRGILRVSHTHVDKLRFCLTLLQSEHKKPIRIDTLYVSGLLDKAKRVMNNG